MDEVESISRKCFLKIKCPKCGLAELIEFYEPAFRSKWYISSEWIVKDVVWVDFPPTKKKRRKNDVWS